MKEHQLVCFEEQAPPWKLKFHYKSSERFLSFNFQLEGDAKALGLSANKNLKGQRMIGLWKKTCFEFFLGLNGKPQYLEFNFAPDHNWNAFSLKSYRGDLDELTHLDDPQLMSEHFNNVYSLFGEIDLHKLPLEFRETSELTLNACAILRHKDKAFHYAIRHTEKEPNFHHPSTFVRF